MFTSEFTGKHIMQEPYMFTRELTGILALHYQEFKNRKVLALISFWKAP